MTGKKKTNDPLGIFSFFIEANPFKKNGEVKKKINRKV